MVEEGTHPFILSSNILSEEGYKTISALESPGLFREFIVQQN